MKRLQLFTLHVCMFFVFTGCNATSDDYSVQDMRKSLTHMIEQLIVENGLSSDMIDYIDARLKSIIQHKNIDDIVDVYDLVLDLRQQLIVYRSQQLTTRRMWDDANTIYAIAETINSKLDDIEAVNAEILTTVTVIEDIQIKACSISDSLGTTLSIIDVIDTSLQINLTNVQTIYQKVETINSMLDIIHVDDFSGTWTAVEELKDVFCEKFESTIDNIATICSKVDELSADNLEQFIATFTKLEDLMDDVFNTMTAVEDFAEQIDNDLSSIDALIDDVSIQLITIESKVDNLSTIITAGFAGTFTTIEQTLETICSAETQLISLQESLNTSFAGTATTLESFIEDMCSVDSKVDRLNDSLSLIKGKVDGVDMALNQILCS